MRKDCCWTTEECWRHHRCILNGNGFAEAVVVRMGDVTMALPRTVMIVGYNTVEEARAKGVLGANDESYSLWYNPGALFKDSFVFIPFGDQDQRLELPYGVHYEEWSFRPRYRAMRVLLALWRANRASAHVAKMVRKRKIDVVRFNGPNLSGLVGLGTVLRGRFPRAMFIEAFWEDLIDHQEYLPSLIRRVAPRWYRLIYRAFDAYCGTPSVDPDFYVARGMRREAIADWTHEVTRQQISSGVDGPDRSPSLSLTGPSLVTVGRLHPEKKSADLIRVLALVRQDYPSARLVLIGDGAMVTELLALARQEGVDHAVTLTGALTQEEAANLVTSCDVYLAPMQGNALVEALILGMPIVAYDNAWHRRLIDDGVNGLLVKDDSPEEMARGALRILDDPALRMHLESAARLWAEEFATPDFVGRTLADVFYLAWVRSPQGRSSVRLGPGVKSIGS